MILCDSEPRLESPGAEQDTDTMSRHPETHTLALARGLWAERRYEGPVPEPVLRWLKHGENDTAARRHAKAQAAAIERLLGLTRHTLAKHRGALDILTMTVDRRLIQLSERLMAYRARACALALSARA